MAKVGHTIRMLLTSTIATVLVFWLGWMGAVLLWSTIDQARPAESIVVLGAAQYNGVPSPLFQGRLDHAVLLWQQGRADLVITVGSKQPGDRHTEAESGAAYLEQHGVPADKIVALPTGHTTYQSLQAATNEMARRDLGSAFLVSDPWHNARLDAMGSDLGIEAYPSATWTSADTSVITRGKEYARETFAYLYYRLFGGG